MIAFDGGMHCNTANVCNASNAVVITRMGVRKKQKKVKEEEGRKGGPAQFLGHLVVPSMVILPAPGPGLGCRVHRRSRISIDSGVPATYARLLSA